MVLSISVDRESTYAKRQTASIESVIQNARVNTRAE